MVSMMGKLMGMLKIPVSLTCMHVSSNISWGISLMLHINAAYIQVLADKSYKSTAANKTMSWGLKEWHRSKSMLIKNHSLNAPVLSFFSFLFFLCFALLLFIIQFYLHRSMISVILEEQSFKWGKMYIDCCFSHILGVMFYVEKHDKHNENILFLFHSFAQLWLVSIESICGWLWCSNMCVMEKVSLELFWVDFLI